MIMKKINIKYILMLFVTACLSVACDDDNLTEVNPNNLSVSSFWMNLKDTDGGLTATYNAMLNENLLGILNEGIRSDMGWPGFGRPRSNRDGLRTFYEQTYNESDGFIQAKWDACYTLIFRANQVIEALERIESNITEGERNNWISQMAQARFFRGLGHFYLHSSYNNGNVIIRNKVPLTTEDLEQPVSPAAEVLSFFREDLQFAFDNLPLQYNNPQSNSGRVTKGTAATILGTSFLYESQYEAAIPLFNGVIRSGVYELVDDMDLLFTRAGEFNAESIFELNYTNDFRTDIGVFQPDVLTNQLAVKTTNNEGPNLPVWLVNEYKVDPIDFADERNTYEVPSSLGTFEQRSVSLRTNAMVAIVDDDDPINLYYQQVTGIRIVLGNSGWGFGRYKKYTNHDIGTGEGGMDPRGSRASGKNIVVNRLAEVYLMQAECLIKTGNISGALELINTVRHRWALRLLGPPNPKWPSSTFDDEVYDETRLMEHLMFTEKPLELSLEGHQTRWNDLRRWGVIRENFQRLSEQTFYASNKQVRRLDGTLGRARPSSSIGTTPIPAVGNGLNIIDYEYEDAAINYTPELHDYYPIPLGEIRTNPNIN